MWGCLMVGWKWIEAAASRMRTQVGLEETKQSVLNMADSYSWLLSL
jgi:hypothetical protein